MARDALATDRRHQAHLEVGLSNAEGMRVFADAVELQLPHLLVSTTPLDASRFFYEPVRPSTPTDEVTPAADELTDVVSRLLGVDALDPAASSTTSAPTPSPCWTCSPR